MIKDWRDVIDVDFPDVEIIEKMIESGLRQTKYLAYCGTRLATGRIVTSAMIEDRRRLLNANCNY